MVETEDLPAGGRRRLMCPAQRFHPSAAARWKEKDCRRGGHVGE